MLLYYVLILIILVLGLAFYLSYIKPRREPSSKAEELVGQNKYAEAIEEYKKLLYSRPDSFNIHFKISKLYARLENYDQAIFHLNEIIRIDKYNLEVQKTAVLRELAESYHYLDDIEKAFQAYFEIIKLNPEDTESYYHISFIALGQEEFEIAQKYFEKLIKLQDNFESFFGAGICSYQNKKNEDAVSYFREALSIKPASDIATLAISFALQRSGKYNEAITYLSKLTARSTEDSVSFISKRLLSFLNFQADKKEEGMRIMESLVDFSKEKNMADEVKLSLYDSGYACIKNNLLDKAYNYWDELYRTDSNYEDIKEKLGLIKMEINRGSGSDGFENSIHDYIEDWETNAFPQDFLWNICGLKSNKALDIRNIVVPVKVSKTRDSAKPDISGSPISGSPLEYGERIERFCALDSETFRMVSGRIILKLGNKVDEILHTYRESDGVDILSLSQDNNEKVLAWVRRWKGSKIGEITLRNFAQAINDTRAQKGILITTAELTQAAEASLEKLGKVRVIYPGEVNELLKGLV